MLTVKTITVLVCATSILTLSVTMSEADVSSKDTRVEPIEHPHDREGVHSVSKTITAKSENNRSNDNAHVEVSTELNGSPEEAKPSLLSEMIPKTAPTATVVADGIKLTSEDLAQADTKSKLPKIRNASVVARKGAIPTSKITARKGVRLESFVQPESSVEGIDEAVHTASVTTGKIDEKNITKAEKIEPKEAQENAGTPASPANNNQSTVKDASTTTDTPKNTSTTAETTVSDAPVTLSSLTTKRFKPKPTVTIGEMDIDKPIPASPTKTPPLGMPRKIDYIVPVIITIVAVPLLGGVAFFMYRRGRDCWDKRHYRRMDFLIDGMYNDYSWK